VVEESIVASFEYYCRGAAAGWCYSCVRMERYCFARCYDYLHIFGTIECNAYYRLWPSYTRNTAKCGDIALDKDFDEVVRASSID
jgi:hypothetical protein